MSEAPIPAAAVSQDDQRSQPAIEVRGLEMAYDSYVLMRDVDFTVAPAEIMERLWEKHSSEISDRTQRGG
jgi:hypothetical protein